MRIFAPADSAREAAALIEAGAGALYFGYMPAAWTRERGFLESFNRRSFPEAQVNSEEEAGAMAAEAASRGVPLWATLNAAYYTADMHRTVMETARRLREMGVHGFIVSDPGLLEALGREGLGPLSLSTLGGVFNTRAARFWARQGVERVTFPRELPPAGMRGVADANPGMRFDAFVLHGACPNVEGFCRWVHDDPRRVWPCVKEYRLSGTARPAQERAAAAQLGWCGLSRVWACGLCALHDLSSSPNIEGLKIVGRGAPTPRKLAAVVVLRELLGDLEGGMEREAFLEAARRAKRRWSGSGCHPYLCYHPEYLP